jgi:hypothetical protein
VKHTINPAIEAAIARIAQQEATIDASQVCDDSQAGSAGQSCAQNGDSPLVSKFCRWGNDGGCVATHAWHATKRAVSWTADTVRLPDYVNVNLGRVWPIVGVAGFGIGGNFTITRYGRVYSGPEFDGGGKGWSASVRAGWILQKTTPTRQSGRYICERLWRNGQRHRPRSL